MKAFVILLALILVSSCQKKQNDRRENTEREQNNKRFFYLGVATYAPKFEENIPSFGGGVWSVPMKIVINGETIAKIEKGGHSLYIKSPKKTDVVEFIREQESNEPVYIMAYMLTDEGAVNVRWKKIIKEKEKITKLNLFSGYTAR